MAEIALRNVSKTYGPVRVIESLSLEIRDGEFVSFVGPSGCGKSTLLRMICGIEEVSAGTVEIGGERANDLPPYERGVAMVFQSYALYPHMTVRENMGYALKLAKVGRAEMSAAVQAAASTLKIDHLLDRFPRQLSGGQRQRVAIGRAIVRKPRVFLFDEPLSNLDAELRVEMRVEIARLASRLGTTMIYVTHDQTEAMTLSDRIVVLLDGKVQQVDEPMHLFRNPANTFVAGFIGSPKINMFKFQVVGGECAFTGGARSVPGGIAAPLSEGGSYVLGVRPEDLRLTSPAPGSISGRVVVVERLGSDTYVHMDSDASERPVIVRLPASSVVPRTDELVGLELAGIAGHVFDLHTGLRISPDQISAP